MTTVFAMTPGAWGAVRFAPSWLWEIMLAVRTLTVRHHQAVHAPWLAQVDRTAVGAAAPVLAALIPRRGWTPDFVSPPSAPGADTFVEQLGAVQRCAPEAVAGQLARSLASSPSRARARLLQPLADDPVRGRTVVVDQLIAAWELLVAPWEERLRRLFDAELRRRSETAVAHGLIAAVDGLHPAVSARAGAVECVDTDDVTVRCRELVLAPSVFSWPFPVVLTATSPPALVYPVPGVGRVWETPVRATAAAAGVLGRGRADVLTALTEPTTTTALAGRLRAAPSTVSEHLAALGRAGLVVPERRGRLVLYRRTAVGASLVAGTTPSSA